MSIFDLPTSHPMASPWLISKRRWQGRRVQTPTDDSFAEMMPMLAKGSLGLPQAPFDCHAEALGNFPLRIPAVGVWIPLRSGTLAHNATS